MTEKYKAGPSPKAPPHLKSADELGGRGAAAVVVFICNGDGVDARFCIGLVGAIFTTSIAGLISIRTGY